MKVKLLVIAMGSVLSMMAAADEAVVDLTHSDAHESGALVVDLGSIVITLERPPAALGQAKASDVTVARDKLQQRSSTLGNALAAEPGIHSNPFGVGLLRP